MAQHFSVWGRGGKGVGVTMEGRLHRFMVKGRRWRWSRGCSKERWPCKGDGP